MDNKISKTFLFKECVLKRHTIGLNFIQPIVISGKKYSFVCLQEFYISEAEKELLLQNVAENYDLYGTFKAKVYTINSNPFHLDVVMIDTQNIESYEMIN